MKRLWDEITAVRFYWQAYGVISGRNGHVYKGPEWTFWRGLRELAKSMQRLHRGELKPWAPSSRKPVDVREYVKGL